MSSRGGLVVLAQTSGITDRGTELAMHPTVKPVALVADAILDCSKRGGIILDVFAGRGTTLIAAEKAGRRGYGIEIDCHYTDIIIRRFDEVYGLKAVHAESKLDFERLTSERFKEKRHGRKTKSGKGYRSRPSLLTSSSARFGAASPTQLCERFRTSS
jgi:DNA methylase